MNNLILLFLQKVQQNQTLTDSKLQQVAQRLTKEVDIYNLGVELGLQHAEIRLGLLHAEIQSDIKNNKYEITMAAYHMLQAWVVQQQDRKHAFALLVTALERAGLQSIIDEVLQGN